MTHDPQARPAPSCLKDLAGTFYVARGREPFAEYLHADGSWRRNAHYFPGAQIAYAALAQVTGNAIPLAIPLGSNLDAEAVESRQVKRAYLT